MTLLDSYAELIALTQLYLFQEHSSKDWLTTDLQTFRIFKEYALNSRAKPVISQEKTAMSRQTEMAVPSKIEQEPVKLESSPPIIQPIKASSPHTQTFKTEEPPSLLKPAIEAAEPEQKPLAEKNPEAPISKSFSLEPMTEIPQNDYNELKAIFKEKFPNAPWVETIPSKEEAKKVEEAPSPVAIILTYHESGEQLVFLENMARAVERYYGTTVLLSAADIERENGWESLLKNKNLRLCISSYASMQSLNGLMKYFKESAKRGSHFLGSVPLCLLSDITVYLKEPHLKKPLWQSIQLLLRNGK